MIDEWRVKINMTKKSEEKVKKRKSKKQIVLDVLMVFFLLIAVGSVIYIGQYYYKIVKSEKQFENLKEGFEEDYVDEEGNIEFVEIGNQKIFKKYAGLYAENNDFIGWLTIEGTKIDYPVMYTPEEEEYYIHRDFNREYSSSGTLFIDTSSVPTGDTTDNILIYGHNMKAGTMFHGLLDYESEDFYQEHKYIQFDTLEGQGTYEVIAAFRTQIYAEDDTAHYHYYEFFDASDASEFDEYVEYVKSNTPYTIETTAEYGDQLLTLSTCAYHTDEGRYVVVAKKIN